jgi:hypothetical protein
MQSLPQSATALAQVLTAVAMKPLVPSASSAGSAS